MFKTRLLSGIVLVAVLILTVGMGGPVLYTVLLAASLIGLMELYRTVKVQNQALGVVGYLGAIGYYILMYQNKMEYIMPLIILVLMLAMAVYVFAYPKFVAEQVMTVFFGVIYVAVMLSFVYQTRCLPDGMVMVWLIFLSSWGCDTCAYCVGMLIGKHSWRSRRCSTSWCDFCGMYESFRKCRCKSGTLRSDLWRRRCDLSDWRFVSICD